MALLEISSYFANIFDKPLDPNVKTRYKSGVACGEQSKPL
jgi:hypothetical protein